MKPSNHKILILLVVIVAVLNDQLVCGKSDEVIIRADHKSSHCDSSSSSDSSSDSNSDSSSDSSSSSSDSNESKEKLCIKIEQPHTNHDHGHDHSHEHGHDHGHHHHANETCPPCDPQAGCPQVHCPCYVGNVEYDAPPHPTKSPKPGCPDCAPVPVYNCTISRVRIMCSSTVQCTEEQLKTYHRVHNYGGPVCPPCDPQAGCPQNVCPCYFQNQRYVAPRHPVKSPVPGCADCIPVPTVACEATRHPVDCSVHQTCTSQQLATYHREFILGPGPVCHCPPFAGCPSTECPCFVGEQQYVAPRIPTHSPIPGCFCPAVVATKCLAPKVCIERPVCSKQQLQTFTPVIE